MYLDDAETDLLKKWIIKKLEDVSDADSDVLADYVLALIKNDDPAPVAKATCLENLKDFLLDNAEPFVGDLFLAISTKSYDPNRPLPRRTAPVYSPPRRASFEQPALPAESKKRSFHDWDREETSNHNGQIPSWQGGDRPVKQPRRGGRGYDQRGGRQSQMPTQQYGVPSQPPMMPQMLTPPPGMPPIDPNNPMASLLAMQQALGMFQGLQNGGSPLNMNPFALPRSGKRCRDYDTKGYCAAGVSCPYEHGSEIVIPQVNQEYDPNNAKLLDIAPSRIGHFNTSPNHRPRGGPRGRRRGRGNWRGGGQRSEYSQLGPNRDRSITSVVVEQIPEDKYDEQTVRDFFSEFGNVEEVMMHSEKMLAIVKYDTYDAAETAYDSPKVVFDNRFVKVYWYRPEKMEHLSNGHSAARGFQWKTDDVEMQEDEKIDPVQFAKQQEEAQRKHDEAKMQREEAEKQKQDLDAKLKAMDAERKKMAELLARKTGKTTSTPAHSPQANGSEENERTKALKAQLAKLEAEAKSLGINPDAPTNGFNGSTTYRGRGGYRGRARGRGFYQGHRGGWAGAGGRGGAVMRLDNRPKTVAVTFADGDYQTHDEALRQFLLFNSLESATIAKHPERDDTALVTFSQRYEGENFMATASGSELPHVGKVELLWYKLDEKPITITSGSHDDAAKPSTAETSEQPVADSGAKDAYDAAAEDEDLDRWS